VPGDRSGGSPYHVAIRDDKDPVRPRFVTLHTIFGRRTAQLVDLVRDATQCTKMFNHSGLQISSDAKRAFSGLLPTRETIPAQADRERVHGF
jgi:hypothetical protein